MERNEFLDMCCNKGFIHDEQKVIEFLEEYYQGNLSRHSWAKFNHEVYTGAHVDFIVGTDRLSICYRECFGAMSDCRFFTQQQIGEYLMTKKIIETPVVLTELQEPIAVTKDGIELNKVIDKANEIRLNELEARLDYNDRRIAVLMKDREAYIRLMHGRMNNEVGLQAMINGWEDA